MPKRTNYPAPADDLPKGWVRTRLADTIVPKRERISPAQAGDTPFIGMEHVEAHTMRILGTVPAKTMHSSAASFLPGDVLYGRLRPYLNKVVRPDFKGLCSAEFIVFPDTPTLRSRFLQYRLNASDFVRFASQLNAGDRPRVDFEQFGVFEIALPPPDAQDAIASHLDELFTDLDAGVAALQRVRAKLKRYRASVLKAAVEGRLTAEWRQTHPPAETAAELLKRILAERRQKWEADQLAKFAAAGKPPPKGWQKKYVAPAAPDTASLPALPEGWCWATFDQSASEVTVGHVGPMKAEYLEKGIPFLRSQNVRPLRFDPAGIRYIPDTFDTRLGKSRLYGGELLVVRSGSVGDACVYPDGAGSANCADLVITRLLSGVRPQYAAVYVSSPGGKDAVGLKKTGSALTHFNIGAMKVSALPLPPLAEQHQVVAEVERRLSVADEVEAQIDTNLKRAARLRQAVLKNAFAGRWSFIAGSTGGEKHAKP